MSHVPTGQVDVIDPLVAFPDPIRGLGPTYQVNTTLAFPPCVSDAVTVTVLDPIAVGVPLITPLEEIVSPAGSPVAEKVGVCPAITS
jgi:hypothetical protein